MDEPKSNIHWRLGGYWLIFLAPFFFITYGFANWLTAQRVEVPSFAFEWEKNIPLWPWMIIPYWSIDLLYGISLFLVSTRERLTRHALRLFSAQIICVISFLLFPLTFSFERPAIEGAFGWLFDVLMGFDQPYNQAPSLHITLLVILWYYYRLCLSRCWRVLIHIWFSLIGLSVLTTWQHHFIDVPIGLIAGCCCIWLWPESGMSVLQWRLSAEIKQNRLGLIYFIGAMLSLITAVLLSGVFSLLLGWLSLSLFLVAMNYLFIGASGFQKQAAGYIHWSSQLLFAPYLVFAWINIYGWLWKKPKTYLISDNVYVGSILPDKTHSAFNVILDLCAELPCRINRQYYYRYPVLDLIPPDWQTCLAAATTLQAHSHDAKVLVCCALGYSRSAMVVASWLLLTKKVGCIADAEKFMRRQHPHLVFSDHHYRVLEQVYQYINQQDILRATQ